MEVIVEKLKVIDTIKEGVNLGISNFITLFLASILYILTFWIPYLNVGTTIGMYRLVLKLSKGEDISAVSIFDKANFSQIGDFFLLMGFTYMGTLIALCFFIIPGIVIAIAWQYSIYVLLDKGETANRCMSASYSITFGQKWRIFFTLFLVGLGISIICGLLCLIPYVGYALAVIAAIVSLAIYYGVEAMIYRHLSKKLV